MSIDLEFEGKDVSEAVEKACFAHQVTEAELDYEVIRQESKKIFGLLGGKTALIRVLNQPAGGREVVQDIIKSTFKGDGFNLASAPPREKAPLMSAAAESESRDQHPENPEAETAVPVFADAEIRQSLEKTLELMGFGPVTLVGRKDERELYLDIQGDDIETLTRKRGAVIDALQFVINKIHGVKGGRILLDCNGFRSRHEEDISGLALRLGAKAKRLRKPVTINSLNAHDRRLVHMALQ
ncbi:MAG: Jag N-terminal domain-containing protein, partial [Deltaproteobacteria bacterium]|nr:Jag N-terminal domain-containing protein [Deltaproteobacteria bacterium]